MNLQDLLKQVNFQNLGVQMIPIQGTETQSNEEEEEFEEETSSNLSFLLNSLQSFIQQSGITPTLGQAMIQQTNATNIDSSPIQVPMFNLNDTGLSFIPLSSDMIEQLGLQESVEKINEQISNIMNLEKYKILEKIGEGGFGKVYTIEEKETGEIFAAKISLQKIDEDSKELVNDLSREVNISIKLNHPFILKYIGYSPINFKKKEKPVIITEFAPNGSLDDILNSKTLPIKWDDTQKMITIYCIALAMSYLHSHNIIHRDLKPGNILIDKFWLPKVADFGLSKFIFSKNKNDSIAGSIKGTPVYISPEIWLDGNYSKACDVYAFAFIVFEIISNEKPYDKANFFDIINKIRNNERPKFNSQINQCWKNLIEICWSQDPCDRPSFDQIVDLLKNDEKFITENVDKEKFYQFIENINENEISFVNDKNIKVDKSLFIEDFLDIAKNSKKYSEDSNVKFWDQIDEIDSIKICPIKKFFKLNVKCKELVKEAETDSQKQFIVAQSFIEGRDYFLVNTQLGIKYLRHSIQNGCIESAIYYFNLLNKGKIIPKYHEKAKRILDKYIQNDKSLFFLLLGKLFKNENKFSEAVKYFEKSIDLGNGEALYEYGDILLYGKGQQADEEKGIHYFKQAIEKDCVKAMLKYGLLLMKKNEENNEEAIHYIKMAADKGYTKAMFHYYTIVSNSNDDDEEVDLYLRKLLLMDIQKQCLNTHPFY